MYSSAEDIKGRSLLADFIFSLRSNIQLGCYLSENAGSGKNETSKRGERRR